MSACVVCHERAPVVGAALCVEHREAAGEELVERLRAAGESLNRPGSSTPAQVIGAYRAVCEEIRVVVRDAA